MNCQFILPACNISTVLEQLQSQRRSSHLDQKYLQDIANHIHCLLVQYKSPQSLTSLHSNDSQVVHVGPKHASHFVQHSLEVIIPAPHDPTPITNLGLGLETSKG